MTVADSSKSIARNFKRHCFCAEIIGHAVRLYFRFPLSLRHVENLLAERSIDVSFQMVSEGRPSSAANLPRHTSLIPSPSSKPGD